MYYEIGIIYTEAATALPHAHKLVPSVARALFLAGRWHQGRTTGERYHSIPVVVNTMLFVLCIGTAWILDAISTAVPRAHKLIGLTIFHYIPVVVNTMLFVFCIGTTWLLDAIATSLPHAHQLVLAIYIYIYIYIHI